MFKRLLLGLALLALAGVAYGAVTPNSFVTPQTPKLAVVQFLQGTDSAGTYKTLYTGGSNGSKCNAMYITSNDGTAHLVTIQVVRSGVFYGGIAISTGTTTPGFANSAPPINPMSSTNWPGLPVDSSGQPYIILQSADTIQATFATALTASDLINIVAVCSDF